MSSQHPRPTADTPLPDHAPARDERAIAEGRLLMLSVAMRAEPARIEGGKPGNRQLLVLLGWTIYVAAREGVLDDVFRLREIVTPEVLRRLDSSMPKLLADRPPPRGMLPVARDFKMKIEELLRVLREAGQAAAAWGQNPYAVPPSDQASGAVRADADADADVDAVDLVRQTWHHLSHVHTDEMPPDVVSAYLRNPLMPDFWFGREPDYVKAAWVCDYLRERIKRRAASGAAPATGTPEVAPVASGQQLQGYVRVDQIWLAYPTLTILQRDAVRKRLTYWAQHQGGAVKEDELLGQRRGKVTRRRRLAYPADQAIKAVAAVLGAAPRDREAPSCGST